MAIVCVTWHLVPKPLAWAEEEGYRREESLAGLLCSMHVHVQRLPGGCWLVAMADPAREEPFGRG